MQLGSCWIGFWCLLIDVDCWWSYPFFCGPFCLSQEMGSLTTGAASTSSVATETTMGSSGRTLGEVRFRNIELSRVMETSLLTNCFEVH